MSDELAERPFKLNIEERINGLDATPNEDLRELVEKWRENAEEMYSTGMLVCAEDLEELIDDA